MNSKLRTYRASLVFTAYIAGMVLALLTNGAFQIAGYAIIGACALGFVASMWHEAFTKRISGDFKDFASPLFFTLIFVAFGLWITGVDTLVWIGRGLFVVLVLCALGGMYYADHTRTKNITH